MAANVSSATRPPPPLPLPHSPRNKNLPRLGPPVIESSSTVAGATSSAISHAATPPLPLRPRRAMAAGLLLGDAAALRACPTTVRSSRRSTPRLSFSPRALPRPRGAAACHGRGHVARFAASASGGGEEELSEEEARREWETEMTQRLKEAEEMEELERTAEELQSEAAGAGEEESEEEKRERVRRELQKVAKEQAERRATAKQMFDLGQRAYGKGMYGRSIEFLEAALTIIRPSSLLGGEIQIWLAMAYDANRRHKDCIALYKELESTHPMINIRRQAAELRYISEAPKLKISNDEVVTIPQIGSSWDWYAGTWSDKTKEQEEKKRKMVAAATQAEPSANTFGDFYFLRPPNEWNKSAWVIVTLWIVLIGTAVYLLR